MWLYEGEVTITDNWPYLVCRLCEGEVTITDNCGGTWFAGCVVV